MDKNVFIFFSVFLLVACSGPTKPQGLLSQEEIDAIKVSSPNPDQKIVAGGGVIKAIEKANEICSKVIGDRDDLSNKRSSRSLWISLGGLVSGSIIAPVLLSANAAANAAWIAAFSSAGGAANVANQTIGDAGYSGAADAKIVNDISAKVNSKMSVALDETKSSEVRYRAAIEAGNECTYYPRYIYTLAEPK